MAYTGIPFPYMFLRVCMYVCMHACMYVFYVVEDTSLTFWHPNFTFKF